jgi:hypothetical protein
VSTFQELPVDRTATRPLPEMATSRGPTAPPSGREMTSRYDDVGEPARIVGFETVLTNVSVTEPPQPPP